jgi:lipoate-protein ligase A
MSVDEALLCHVERGGPVLRLYRWERPGVSLGYRQKPPPWLSRCAAHGVEVVRRVTGGGAVLHAGDLTYAVLAPSSGAGLPREMRASYEWIRGVLIDGLRSLGLPAAPSAPSACGDRAEVCFAGATGMEVAVAERKLVGSAQRRVRWGLLQHGSLRLSDDSALYRALTGDSPGPPAVADCDSRKAEQSLVAAFERALGFSLEPATLSPAEAGEAHARRQLRLGDPLAAPPVSSRGAGACADRLP